MMMRPACPVYQQGMGTHSRLCVGETYLDDEDGDGIFGVVLRRVHPLNDATLRRGAVAVGNIAASHCKRCWGLS
jgi:hypothetical protein